MCDKSHPLRHIAVPRVACDKQQELLARWPCGRLGSHVTRLRGPAIHSQTACTSRGLQSQRQHLAWRECTNLSKSHGSSCLVGTACAAAYIVRYGPWSVAVSNFMPFTCCQSSAWAKLADTQVTPQQSSNTVTQLSTNCHESTITSKDRAAFTAKKSSISPMCIFRCAMTVHGCEHRHDSKIGVVHHKQQF